MGIGYEFTEAFMTTDSTIARVAVMVAVEWLVVAALGSYCFLWTSLCEANEEDPTPGGEFVLFIMGVPVGVIMITCIIWPIGLTPAATISGIVGAILAAIGIGIFRMGKAVIDSALCKMGTK